MLTTSECDQLLALAEVDGESQDGSAWNSDASDFIVDHRYRRTQIFDIKLSDEAIWLKERLHEHFAVSMNYFSVNCQSPSLCLFVGRYPPGAHYQAWHRDTGVDSASSRRLLSLSIQLNCPRDYSGGNLEIFPYATGDSLRANQGDGVLFESTRYHRVTPVLEGTRLALVAWMSGPGD